MTASSNELPIGVFDSGVGGLTVLQAIRNELPIPLLREVIVSIVDDGLSVVDSGQGPQRLLLERQCRALLE